MNKQTINVSKREAVLRKYSSARANLILMIALTVVNIILIFTGSDTVMLFSATIPYFAVVFGIKFSKFSSILIGCAVIAVTTLIGYFLCWLLSKKHYGWLIGALVMFLVDTLVLGVIYISIGDVSGILDAAIHLYVIYYLISGIINGVKLQKMPEDEVLPDAEEQSSTEVAASQLTYSPRLRRADENVKFRVLAEADAAGHHICYRRIKKVNELVVDGYVYDEVSMLIETPHELNAVVAGNQITAKMDDTSHSCIIVNGQIVARKLRLY